MLASPPNSRGIVATPASPPRFTPPMSSLDPSVPEKDTARLLVEARRALRLQQEAAATSVHLAQAILHAFQKTAAIAQRAVEEIPGEDTRERYAEEMTRVTRALAGVVEEFSPGLTPDADRDLPAPPAAAAPLPEEFFLWLRQRKGGATLTRADAIISGRNLWSRANAEDRNTLVTIWCDTLRARANALLQLAAARYST